MAYRIRMHAIEGVQGGPAMRDAVSGLMYALDQAVKGAGFKVGEYDYVGSTNGRGPSLGSQKPGFIVDLRKIRLAKPKPYCGNHPGPCDAGGTRTKAGLKPAARYLEWEDWVRLHEVVNDVLDNVKADADITTSGADVDKGRLLFCRRGLKRRLRYDWSYNPRDARLRPVNYGSDDQFEPSSVAKLSRAVGVFS